MAQIREIKKRIVAVRSIQRITKTMQMIATAKFTAALARAKQTKPYSEKVRQVVAQVAAAAGDITHPLINGPAASPRREMLLVISSDRGLCGAYNSNVLRKAVGHIRDLRSRNVEFDVHTSGRKATGFFKFQRIPIAERFSFGDKIDFGAVQKLADRYMQAFTEGKYDAVRVVYMRFESAARQRPEIQQLLPIQAAAAAEQAVGTGADAASAKSASAAVGGGAYEFSPSSEVLLAALLPLTVNTSLFQAFNDALVSEQIMRKIAMKAATENAKDLGKTLGRNYNRARQSRITTELMEVISGSAALA